MLQRAGGRAFATQSIDESLKLLEDDLRSLGPDEREVAIALMKERLLEHLSPSEVEGLSLFANLGLTDSDDPELEALEALFKQEGLYDDSGDEVLDTLAQEIIEDATPIDWAALTQRKEAVGSLYDLLGAKHFKTRPVDIQTFISDPYYLGNTCDVTFPGWKLDLEDVFNGNYNEVILTGGLSIGKTFCCSIGMVYGIYELSCMRNPQTSFGLSLDTQIVFAGFSVNEELAKEVVLKNIIGKVAASPYFMNTFKPRITQKNIRFPNNIIVLARATTDTGVLGMAVYMGLMDESDFMPKKKKRTDLNERAGIQSMAKAIYDGLRRRMQGRFGKYGKIFLPCSKTTMDSFVQTRIDSAAKDSTVFVRDYALWEIKPGDYSDVKFWVLCGSEAVNSRLIYEEHEAKRVRDNLPERATLIEVPDNFLSAFESDLEGCLTGDTLIPLLSGEEVTIASLVGRESFGVYSYGADGKLYPGRGYDARLTREKAPIFAVTLDNGQVVRCTGNHPFMRRDGTYCAAEDLKPLDRLMPWNRRFDRYGYEMVQSNVGGRWVHTHRIVAREAHREGVHLVEGEVIHHRNFKRADNTPENLQIMNAEDHYALHTQYLGTSIHSPQSRKKAAAARSLKAQTDPAFMAMLTGNLSKAQAAYAGSEKNIETGRRSGTVYGFGREVLTEAQIAARKANGTRTISMLNASDANPSKKPENREASRARMLARGPAQSRSAAKKGLHSRWKHPGEVEDCPICQGWVTPAYKLKDLSKEKGLDTVQRARKATHVRKAHGGDFRACTICFPTNHKVVSVEFCGHEDVYDISVADYHNFATSAGVVVHNSIRDLAGVATAAVSPFFQQRKKVQGAVDATRVHPFSVEVLDPAEGGHLLASLMVQGYEVIDPYTGATYIQRPIYNPTAKRAVHIDASTKHCASGFVMAHQAGTVEVLRQDGYSESRPFYMVDFALQVVPPIGGEIEIGLFRRLIYDLTALGYQIERVTLDQYQSADTMQQLRMQGYESSLISANWEAYQNLKDVIYEGRLNMYEYPPLMRELRSIEADWEKRQIIKPKEYQGKAGSKDMTDALAGVIKSLTLHPARDPIPALKGFSGIASEASSRGYGDVVRHYAEQPRQPGFLTDPNLGRGYAGGLSAGSGLGFSGGNGGYSNTMRDRVQQPFRGSISPEPFRGGEGLSGLGSVLPPLFKGGRG